MDDRQEVGPEATLPLSEVRKLEVDILLEVGRVCGVLGLEYFLTYGTLWGAVSEGGFLRGDDDIDIILPRSDYEVLARRFDEYARQGYRLLSPRSCSAYYYSFSKVTDSRTRLCEPGLPDIPGLGVNIDVFPLDEMPRGRIRYAVHSLRLRLLHNARFHALVLCGRIWRRRQLTGICRAIVRLFAERFDALSRSTSGSGSGWVCCDVGGRIDGTVFERSVGVRFEGRTFPAPRGYHRYLTRLYGDYDAAARDLEAKPAHRTQAWWHPTLSDAGKGSIRLCRKRQQGRSSESQAPPKAPTQRR